MVFVALQLPCPAYFGLVEVLKGRGGDGGVVPNGIGTRRMRICGDEAIAQKIPKMLYRVLRPAYRQSRFEVACCENGRLRGILLKDLKYYLTVPEPAPPQMSGSARP